MIRASAFGLTALALLGSAATATQTTYSSRASFAAATTITNTAGFDQARLGPTRAPLTDDGITFTTLAIDLYVTAAGEGLTQNPNSFPTRALSADGEENFRIELASGATFGSIGLYYATNRFGAPVLSLYTPAGDLIAALDVPIAADTIGFFGVVSTTPIGYVTSIVDRGYIEDTAIDNVQIGWLAVAPGVPEPGLWAMWIAGFGLAGGASRLQRRGAPADQ